MVRANSISPLWLLVLSCFLLTGLFSAMPARAQDQYDDGSSAGSSYRTTDDNTYDNQEDNAVQPVSNSDDTPANNASDGPVRLARFAYVRGNVTWRGDESMDWSEATTNLPIRQGAQIWVTGGGRAEIQFDDGSVLRLGNGALATLKVLYSDADGEFTQIILTNGLATLAARHDHSIYQIDTPLVSVKTTGPSRIRLGAGNGVEIAVQRGQATVEGEQGKVDLQRGDYLDLLDANSAYDPHRLPAEDAWDQWNDDRDRLLNGAVSYCPPNIALVAGDLNDYGTWRDDPVYGHVWCPHVTVADWRPYCYGHWTWVNPFGWTWVSDEPWGWAPYHYGTWVDEPYGWAWVPGPVHQYWCPAVVHFCEYEDRVAWVPLAPAEVRYPSFLSVGFRSGSWSVFFSIGQAAVYYPATAAYCVARPYNNIYVNHVTYINNVTNIYNGGSASYNRYLMTAEAYSAMRGGYREGAHFVPINARNAAGVTVASVSAFGGRGEYQPLPRHQEALFTQGHTVAPPPAGRTPVAGPIAARPTVAALTPTRTLLRDAQPPRSILAQPTYHAPLPTAVRRSLPAVPADHTLTYRPRTTTGGTGPLASRPSGNTTMERSRSTSDGSVTQLPTRSRPPSTNGETARSSYPDSYNTGRRTDQGARTNGMDYGARSSNSRSDLSPADAAARARASLGLPGGSRPQGGQNSTYQRGSDSTNNRGSSGYNRNSGDIRQPAYGRGDNSGNSRPGGRNSYPDSRPRDDNSMGRYGRPDSGSSNPSVRYPVRPPAGDANPPGRTYQPPMRQPDRPMQPSYRNGETYRGGPPSGGQRGNSGGGSRDNGSRDNNSRGNSSRDNGNRDHSNHP